MKLAKSKTAKILKILIDKFEQVPNSLDDQIFVCEKSIEFAQKEKRMFLKNSLTIKLANLHYQKKQYKDSLNLINVLLTEFKKLDDKPSLVDVHLLESKIYHKLRNLIKSKAALTASRTAANSIYCNIMRTFQFCNIMRTFQFCNIMIIFHTLGKKLFYSLFAYFGNCRIRNFGSLRNI
ncbi:hypothetical protein MOSE0_C05468 [Monosporozyma servazzii]